MGSKDKNQSIDSRKGVDFIGVTCVFFCHDGDGRLLMHKRSRNCRDEKGRWDCGSGSMEFGENFEEAVRREIKEEYHVEPEDLKFCGVTNVIRNNKGEKTKQLCEQACDVYYANLNSDSNRQAVQTFQSACRK
ncbi:MAG: NUDIX domain-containing protein [Candidatus Ryanbacteria bacterium]|nr:NUDIX domain-containing protein [Candidatus Ryanbacteria bacterium]